MQPDEFVAAIRRAGTTQAKLARETGVSPSYITDIVKGRRPPSKPVVEALNRLLAARHSEFGGGNMASPLTSAPSASYKIDQLRHAIGSARAQLAEAEHLLDDVAANEMLHALLDRALPPNVDPHRRVAVQAYLQALVDLQDRPT